MKKQTEWSENPFISAEHGSSVSSRIESTINKPLPWFGIFALIVVFLAAQSYQAKQAAFDATTTSLLAEQHFKDYTAKTDEYIEKLRFEMAQHGLIPPEKPK